MGDKNKDLSGSFLDASDSAMTANPGIVRKPPPPPVNDKKVVNSMPGLYGKISNFLDAKVLAAEAEEYMASGQRLTQGWRPDEYMKDNYDFKGFDAGYHNFASQDNTPKKEVPGYAKFYKERASQGVFGSADEYFYNLALTKGYQSAAEEIAKVRDIDEREMSSLQGRTYMPTYASPVHKESLNLQQPYLMKDWKGYQGIISRYGSNQLNAIHGKARKQASEWSNKYRTFLEGEFKGVVDQIEENHVTKQTGLLINTLNDMLDQTEGLETVYNTKQELHGVRAKNSGNVSSDAIKILDDIEKRRKRDLELAGVKIGNIYDPNNVVQKSIIDATK